MSAKSKTFEASMERLETEIVKLMKTADGTPAETEYVRDE